MQKKDFTVVYYRRCRNGVVRRFSRSFVSEIDARVRFESLRGLPEIVKGFLFSYTRTEDSTRGSLECCM